MSQALDELYVNLGVRLQDLRTGFSRAKQITKQGAKELDDAMGGLQKGISPMAKGNAVVKQIRQLQTEAAKQSQKGGLLGDVGDAQQRRLQGLVGAVPDELIRGRLAAALQEGTEAGVEQARRELMSLKTTFDGLFDQMGKDNALVRRFRDAAKQLQTQRGTGGLAGEEAGINQKRLQAAVNQFPAGALKERLQKAIEEGTHEGAREGVEKAEREYANLKSTIDGLFEQMDKDDSIVNKFRNAAKNLQQQVEMGGGVGKNAIINQKRLQAAMRHFPAGPVRDRIQQAIVAGTKEGMTRAQKPVKSGAMKIFAKLRNLFIMAGGVYLFQRMLRTLRRVIVSLLNVTGQFERLQVTLNTITHGRGMETFNALNQWAIKMPINTQTAIQGFVQLRSQGLRPTIADLETLVDTASALAVGGKGGVGELYRSIGNYLARMKATSRVTMEEMRLLGERGVPAVAILRKEFDLSVKDLRRLGHEALDVDRTIASLIEGMNARFGGQAQKMMETYTGMIEILKAKYMEWVRVMMNRGPFQVVKEGMQDLIKWLDSEAGKAELEKWANDAARALLSLGSIIAGLAPLVAEGLLHLIGVVNQLIIKFNELDDSTKFIRGLSDKYFAYQKYVRRMATLGGLYGKDPLEGFYNIDAKNYIAGDSDELSAWTRISVTNKRLQALIKLRDEYNKLADARKKAGDQKPMMRFYAWMATEKAGVSKHAANLLSFIQGTSGEIEKSIKKYLAALDNVKGDTSGELGELLEFGLAENLEQGLADTSKAVRQVTDDLRRLSMSDTAFQQLQITERMKELRKELMANRLDIATGLFDKEDYKSGIPVNLAKEYQELEKQIDKATRKRDVKAFVHLHDKLLAKVIEITEAYKKNKSDLRPGNLEDIKKAVEAQEKFVAALEEEKKQKEKKSEEPSEASDETIKRMREQEKLLAEQELKAAKKRLAELTFLEDISSDSADAAERVQELKDKLNNLEKAQKALNEEVLRASVQNRGGIVQQMLQAVGKENAAKRLGIELQAEQMRRQLGNSEKAIRLVDAWRDAQLGAIEDVKKETASITFFGDPTSRWQAIQQAIFDAQQKRKEGEEMGNALSSKMRAAFKDFISDFKDTLTEGVSVHVWGY